MEKNMKLIAYLSGGYPTMEKSIQMAEAYVAGGCDAIEWNFPPRNPYMEAGYIAEKMAQARSQCDNYDIYMEQLARFKEKEPQAVVIPMLYQETVLDIGAGRLAEYLRTNGMDTVITADIEAPEILGEFDRCGIKIAPFVSFRMEETAVRRAVESKGFVYMQAMPAAAERTPDFDWNTLKRCIDTLREKGVDRPIYCGGGIRTADDVRLIKKSGGDGFFLGSSLMEYYGEPDRLKAVIGEFRRAALE